MPEPCPITRDRLDPRNIELMDPEMVPVLRMQNPSQRVVNVYRMYEQAKWLARAGVADQFPQWSEAQINAEVQKRLTGARSLAYRKICERD